MDRADVRLAVWADPHYYAPELGTEGPSFEACLKTDTKVLRRSKELFEEALALIRAGRPDVLLIPGDLTKDGEQASHAEAAAGLAALRESGIRVLLIPGNHDLNNPWAFSYRTEPPARVKNVSPAEFLALYGKFGYEGALLRDPSSLSYLAEPVPGLRVLALDVCDYARNDVKPVTAGRLKPETAAWAVAILEESAREGKTVLGLMHHGLLEHHRFQSALMADFVVADWQAQSKRLAEAGLKVVFTGHYHTQDIALARFDGGRHLFDIETGSTLTYPCPIRFADLEGTKLKVRTVNLAGLPGRVDPLREESLRAFEMGIGNRAVGMMTARGLTPEAAFKWSPYAVEAYLAHTVGDESPGPEQKAALRRLAGQGHPALAAVGTFLEALWTNAPPPDNDVTIDLEDGSFA